MAAAAIGGAAGRRGRLRRLWAAATARGGCAQREDAAHE